MHPIDPCPCGGGLLRRSALVEIHRAHEKLTYNSSMSVTSSQASISKLYGYVDGYSLLPVWDFSPDPLPVPTVRAKVASRNGQDIIDMYPVAVPDGYGRFVQEVMNEMVMRQHILPLPALQKHLTAKNLTAKHLDPRKQARKFGQQTLSAAIVDIIIDHMRVPLLWDSQLGGFACASSRGQAEEAADKLRHRAWEIQESAEGIRVSDWFTCTPEERVAMIDDVGKHQAKLCRVLVHHLIHHSNTTGAALCREMKQKGITTSDWSTEGRGGQIPKSTMRDIVAALRRSGVPIVGTSSGYYLAGGQGQADAAVASLNQRAAGIHRRARVLETAAALWYPETPAETDEAKWWTSQVHVSHPLTNRLNTVGDGSA